MRYLLPLDEYEISNLRESLRYLKMVRGDTGDWLGQIQNKLDRVEFGKNKLPNKSAEQQLEELERYGKVRQQETT